MPHNAPPPAASQGRYPIRIPIRMTPAERAVIGKNACASHRSISRYLVEFATQGKPPLAQEDKARLRFLHALFQGATEKMQAALASQRLGQGAEQGAEEGVGARATLDEALRLLEAIGQELGRRLE